MWRQLDLFLVRCACVLLWGVLRIGKRCGLECSICGSLMPFLPCVFFAMCTGVRLWVYKCMPCKWECTMPAWHVHVDRDRDRDMRWLRAALSHRTLYLYGNALTTLPPDVFDSLGSLTYVIPVPRECVVAANTGHEWQFVLWSMRVRFMCLMWRACRWCVCVHTASLCLFDRQVTLFLRSLLACNSFIQLLFENATVRKRSFDVF